MRIKRPQHLFMTLQTHEHCLGGRNAAGASEAIRERYLRGRSVVVCGLDSVFGGDFVGVQEVDGTLLREGLDGFDASDAGGDEVVEVVGGEDCAHDKLLSLESSV